MIKKQLNFYIPEAVDADFRDQAQKAGFGSRLTPYLERLLAASHGDLKVIRNLLVQAQNTNPEVFASDAQRYYAREILLLLAPVFDTDPSQGEHVD